MTNGKTIALTIQTFVSKVMSLLFNTLSRFVIAFLPRSKCLLTSWLQSPSTVILESRKMKSATVSFAPPPHLFAMKWWNQMPWSWFFECWVWSQLFPSTLLLSSRSSLVPVSFLPLGWYYLHIWIIAMSPGNLDSSLWFIQPSTSQTYTHCWYYV